MFPQLLIIFLQVFFGLLEWIIIIQSFYSWIRPHSTSFFYQVISSITLPLFRIVRKIVPRFGLLDFTPLFSLLAVEVIAYFSLHAVVKIFS